MNPSIARNPIAESKNALRKPLLEARLQAASEPAAQEAMNRRVLDVLQMHQPACVGFYWPLRGEFDVRGAIAIWLAGSASRAAALPVIGQPGEALQFHAWAPDTPMKIGHHRIPEPTSQTVLIPDLLLVPCVGFDAQGYRLGYGGGYYDRTLAVWPAASKPVTVGIAYETCRIETLAREAHDIPLDLVITEAACYPD
ncbi:5-formyltetrahydrofolate cyclo-ligase [Paraburkholderia sp. DHOC27]|uniref:5-formyltetrahydrofolate cyclo-ligase n=1 Tax=Paraburkholderia sp. DHOC27 TaxID=2303330 RepID=UPI00216B21C5|nr:5-formyltetrahydrofolate cyclo-ligase [Paraburkholderia sp. DHOC27]